MCPREEHGQVVQGVHQQHGGPDQSIVKRTRKYYEVPEEEGWRIGAILEILDENLEIPGLTHEESSEILAYLCTT